MKDEVERRGGIDGQRMHVRAHGALMRGHMVELAAEQERDIPHSCGWLVGGLNYSHFLHDRVGRVSE